jgi:hypothetical protein
LKTVVRLVSLHSAKMCTGEPVVRIGGRRAGGEPAFAGAEAAAGAGIAASGGEGGRDSP